MSDQKKSLIKHLLGIGSGGLILAAAMWVMPGFADASGAADSPGYVELTTEDGVFDVFANIPVNEVKTGQFCQGYANIYNGTAPYDITWTGEFTNADAGPGPLDDEQIVNGYLSGSYGWLKVEVTDSDSPPNTDSHTAWMNIDPSHDLNEDCEA